MALKDWKKRLGKYDKKETVFEKRKVSIVVTKLKDWALRKNKSKPWSVYIYQRDTMKVYDEGMFKTKPQALKFAKSYMETH